MARVKAWLFPEIRKTIVYDLPFDATKAKIKYVFSKAGGLLESTDFSGQFTSEGSFLMASGVRGVAILSFNVATLWGKLTPMEGDKTQVGIRVKPPGELLFGLTLFFLASLYGLAKGVWDESIRTILLSLLLMVGAPYFTTVALKLKVERMYRRYIVYIDKVLKSAYTAPNPCLPK